MNSMFSLLKLFPPVSEFNETQVSKFLLRSDVSYYMKHATGNFEIEHYRNSKVLINVQTDYYLALTFHQIGRSLTPPLKNWELNPVCDHLYTSDILIPTTFTTLFPEWFHPSPLIKIRVRWYCWFTETTIIFKTIANAIKYKAFPK